MRKSSTALNFIFFLFMLGGLLIGCIKNKEIDYDELEQQNIANYLLVNNITTQPTASGLYYIEEEEGTGVQPIEGDTVSINYIAYTIHGYIIVTNILEVANQYNMWQSNVTYEPFEFILGSQEIWEGLNEGISYMKEGGKAKLIIPYRLTKEGNREPYVYDIELVEVKQKKIED